MGDAKKEWQCHNLNSVKFERWFKPCVTSARPPVRSVHSQTMISGVTLAAALAFGGADPCQPHGETNVLTNQCWGAGVAPGCFSCFYGK